MQVTGCFYSTTRILLCAVYYQRHQVIGSFYSSFSVLASLFHEAPLDLIDEPATTDYEPAAADGARAQPRGPHRPAARCGEWATEDLDWTLRP